ncbi:insulinase family protein [Puniceicoccaceae bacterium K14]|nr:insulinase family protein [Puniceicoccaceae bacterium K14]
MSDLSENRSLESSRSMIAPLLREPISRYVLPNGLTVLLKQTNATALCSVQAWVKTGSIHEGELSGAGLSHFVEHMLFKGTARRDGREISQEVQAAGGYINAYTTFDRTVYYIDLPSEGIGKAVDVLNDCLFHSTMPSEEIEKEREVIMREIAMGDDDPDSRLIQTLFETVFRQHSYRYPIIGYKDIFSEVTRDQLWDYYKSRYVPNNVVLVIAGDFEETSARALIDESFGLVKRAALAPIFLPEEPLQLAERSSYQKEDVQITRIALGFQVPGLTDEDTPVLDALAMILGNGNSSLLNLRLREEKKLIHYVDASNWTPGTVGIFYIAMICDVDKRDAVLEELKFYFSSLTIDDFSTEMVSKAVRQILSSEINSRKTVSGQASRLGSAEVVVGDVGYARNYLERVSEISSGDVFRVFKKWMVWNRLSTVCIDPKVEQGTVTSAKIEGSKVSPRFENYPQSNGSSLLLRHDARLPNLHFRVVFQAGALFEEEQCQGATNLLSTLLTKGTEKRTSEEVAMAIESVGGSFYEFSGNNSLGLALEVMPQDADLAIDLLEQSLLHTKFDAETFEIEKESQIATIKENQDDIVSAGRDLLRQKFFGAHPFCISENGTLDTLENIDLKLLSHFWQKLRVAGNVSVAVSGDFQKEELQPKLERLLASLPEGNLVESNTAFDGPAEVGKHRERMDRQQAVVFHAYPCPGLKKEDFYVSEVADEIFSGMSSKLFERVREELSLAYFVRSSRIVGLDSAMFYFYAGTSAERYEEVITELDREVSRMMDGEIEDSELKDCKTRLKASRRMGMQSNSSCASQAAMNVAYGLPANDWENYDSRVDSVSVDSLQNFARTYLSQVNRVELVIGPIEV